MDFKIIIQFIQNILNGLFLIYKYVIFYLA